MTKSVAIVGGGIAGIAAATALAAHDFRVRLFEKRPLLGGRASSFNEAMTGMRLDECQHGTMRCCTNLEQLLTVLGVQEQIQYFDRLEFLDGEGKRSVIDGCGLPAPAHTALSFLRFGALDWRDKLGIVRALSVMLHTRTSKAREDLAIGAWLQTLGQTERAVRRFWRPILVSACNEELDRISCLHAFKLFRDGFLLNATAFHFGVPRVPLATLYHEPTLAYLQARGGCVQTRTLVEKIHLEGGPNGQVAGLTLQNGEHITADYYISALQCDLLLKLLPPEVTTSIAYWENLRRIELSPIIGAHLWFDREIECPPALAILDRNIEWIFNKSVTWSDPPGLEGSEGSKGTYLSIVISASQRFEAMPKAELLALVLDEVRACLPAAHSANVLKSLLIRWPKATIAPKPGVEALRPTQRSPLVNLLVAGEWTATGWPSTMEGAVRSGYLAAEILLAREGKQDKEGKPLRLLAPELPVRGLARLFV